MCALRETTPVWATWFAYLKPGGERGWGWGTDAPRIYVPRKRKNSVLDKLISAPKSCFVFPRIFFTNSFRNSAELFSWATTKFARCLRSRLIGNPSLRIYLLLCDCDRVRDRAWGSPINSILSCLFSLVSPPPQDTDSSAPPSPNSRLDAQRRRDFFLLFAPPFQSIKSKYVIHQHSLPRLCPPVSGGRARSNFLYFPRAFMTFCLNLCLLAIGEFRSASVVSAQLDNWARRS